MSLLTYKLECGRHVARRRRRRRAYAPKRNNASDDNHEKINSWVSFIFPYGYGAPLCDPSSRRSSAKISGEWFRQDSNSRCDFRDKSQVRPNNDSDRLIMKVSSFSVLYVCIECFKLRKQFLQAAMLAL